MGIRDGSSQYIYIKMIGTRLSARRKGHLKRRWIGRLFGVRNDDELGRGIKSRRHRHTNTNGGRLDCSYRLVYSSPVTQLNRWRDPLESPRRWGRPMAMPPLISQRDHSMETCVSCGESTGLSFVLGRRSGESRPRPTTIHKMVSDCSPASCDASECHTRNLIRSLTGCRSTRRNSYPLLYWPV